jgi:hypothetical protein
MAKANQAYHKRDLYSDAAQVMILARYYAKQAVKAQWQRQGIKVHHVKASELAPAANVYLTNHPELIAFATERYRYFVERGWLKPPRTPRRPSRCPTLS